MPSTERVAGVPGGYPPERDASSKIRSVVGIHSRLKNRRKRLKEHREKLSPAASARVGAKIEHLIESGEVPNTKAGRAKAAAMAYSMERSKRLGPRGGYRRKS